jgi:acetyl-CoA C-acetyltransferase
MSRVPMGSDGGVLFDPRFALGKGLVPQGISADLLATLSHISRDEVDEFALESQKRAIFAQDQGVFDQSIVPVVDGQGDVILAQDELIRRDCTLEGLSSLKPAFATMGQQFGLDYLTRRAYPHIETINHVHTPGNSSGIVDGASLVLIGNQKAQTQYGLKPRARILSAVSVGDEPVLMLAGPVPAARKALKKANMSISDIDLFEVNEAFASVPLHFMKTFDVDHAQVNVNGGAIALGHPLGATGAMLLGTVLDALEKRDLRTALITLCIGGGMGIATIIERV